MAPGFGAECRVLSVRTRRRVVVIGGSPRRSRGVPGSARRGDSRGSVAGPGHWMKAAKSKTWRVCSTPLALRTIIVTVWFSGMATPVTRIV